MYVGLLIYGSLKTLSGGFIYDRHLVRYLKGQGDRVEVIVLPWRTYRRSLFDNLNPRFKERLQHAGVDVLLQDELVHPSCFWLNHRLRHHITYPIVSVVHHLRCREQHPAWHKRLYRQVEKHYLDSVDGCVCVSHTTKADVEALVGPDRRLIVATPGKDGLPGNISSEEITSRALAPGPLQVIFVGNLIPRKELHTLLTALAMLPGDGWRLTVAGSLDMEVAYVKTIRRQIAEAGLGSQVTLLGSLSARELAARCATAHLLAIPSSYEGFGIVYLEGMQFGLPAIASTSGAAKEMITHGENGFLVDPGDAAALAQCLKALMTDRQRLVKMGLAAQRRALAYPNWDESAARVRAFIKDFLN